MGGRSSRFAADVEPVAPIDAVPRVGAPTVALAREAVKLVGPMM
jgi:hypothetical protein